jgi:integrase
MGVETSTLGGKMLAGNNAFTSIGKVIMAHNLLSETALRNADPQDKPFKLYDGGGLNVLIHPNGSKYFQLKYRLQGKEKLYSIGVYPKVSLKHARDEASKARTLIDQGLDPVAQRKKDKEPSNTTFQQIAEEWIATKGNEWSKHYRTNVISSLNINVYPFIGNLPIDSIDIPTIRNTLLRMQTKEILSRLQKTRMWIGMIFRYAMATGRCSNDPCYSLRGTFKTKKPKHLPAITKAEDFVELLRKIKSYDGSTTTRLGLMLIAYTFPRITEFRYAKWNEFNFDKAEWSIPGNDDYGQRTKSGQDHIVPLSKQAIKVLEELKFLTGVFQFVFPNERNTKNPMSINTLNNAMHRLGYKGRHCVHGFRSSASTLLNELGYEEDVIERQLAHKEPNKVRGAYHRAEYLPQRKAMMQQWADYVDELVAKAR